MTRPSARAVVTAVGAGVLVIAAIVVITSWLLKFLAPGWYPGPSTGDSIAFVWRPAGDEVAAVPESWRPWLGRWLGRVVDAGGAPVAGVSVESFETATYLRAPPRVDRTVTDADGRFELNGVRPRMPHRLCLDRAGTRAMHRDVTADFTAPFTRDFGDVRLAPPRRAHGRVVSRDGQPIAGAVLRAFAADEAVGDSVPLPHVRRTASGVSPPEPADDASGGARGRAVAISTEDGTFELKGDVGIGDRIVVDHARFVRGTSAPITAFDDGNVALDDLVLDSGRERHGRVVDAAGDPVHGARVFVGTIDDATVVAIERCTTGADGSFVASGIPPGDSAVIAISTDGFAVAVKSATDDAPLDLTLRPFASLSVRVEKPDGSLSARPRLSIECIDPPRRFLLDIRGNGAPTSFPALDFLPGRYRLIAMEVGYETFITDVDLTTGDFGCIEARLAHESTRALRVVASNDHAPIAGAIVTARRLDDTDPFDATACVRVTDADGRAVIDGLPPGECEVTIEHPAFPFAVERVGVDGPPVEIALARGGCISGPPSATPLLRPLVVGARSATQESARVTTSIDGSFRIDALPPGEFALSLEDDAPDGRGTLERVTATVREGATTEVEFAALAGRPVPSGHVHGRIEIDGAPTANRVVSLDLDTPITRRTDAAGRFDFGAVPIGPVFVSLPAADADRDRGDSVFASRSLDLQAGAEAEVEFVLATRCVTGRVVESATRKPVPFAEVELVAIALGPGDIGARLLARADANGAFTFASAPLAASLVSASARGFLDGSIDAGNDPIVLALDRATRVRGRIDFTSDRRGVPGLVLRCIRRDETTRVRFDAMTGEFTVVNARPGACELALTGFTDVDVERMPLLIGSADQDGVLITPKLRKRPAPVRVAGTIRLPDDASRLVAAIVLHRLDADDEDRRLATRLDGGLRFSSDAVTPGRYRVTLEPEGSALAPLEVDIPAGGVANLVLEFAPTKR